MMLSDHIVIPESYLLQAGSIRENAPSTTHPNGHPLVTHCNI